MQKTVNSKDLTEIWLEGDHYQWRAMRSAGVQEELITGSADNYSKYLAFAHTVPKCIGNPIYHWTHLELRRPFGITNILFVRIMRIKSGSNVTIYVAAT